MRTRWLWWIHDRWCSCSHGHRSGWVNEGGTEERVDGHDADRERRVRCEPRRDLRGALAERAARGRRAEEGRRACRPATQRRPLVRSGETASACRARRGAGPCRGPSRVAPERQRVCDRRERVPRVAPDAAWEDDEDRVARAARVPPREKVERHGLLAGGARPLDASSSEPMSDDHEGLAGHPTRCAASGAAGRPGRAARWRSGCPGLDLDLRLDDA